MTGRSVRCYDHQGDCCRMGVWWTTPGWVIRIGVSPDIRVFAYHSTVRGVALYEEVWG